MKVLIYIPKSIKEIENCKNCPLTIQGVCAALRETAPKEGKRVNCPVMAEFVDSAANGDVIKVLFPKEKWKRCHEDRYNRASMQSNNMGINMELWDASYER